ncbi:helix-turn-helix transcriptional regulator [Yersinia aleksiciae]|uniref:helix-turn-helix transcriptional regulator n=1 Tax=Yersinia aleksiciae TaxID=263819 RepID=UPI0005DBD359|nr:LuxR C-terminal-related transcriptional regulator [Yersinia aleksiciae]MDA5498586.1 LuxR C-terminal-related transcriptional regulator [Yersinia aleksiciae]NIK99367.1 response regulator transcription factor [Yersinia aleksiciae]WQC71241.1 LuxR C-terminal-related transcriptional regulator [Yersinia aleksiciae]CFQ41354.1 LuxR family transcriptional regulatory protein [Yersinia aleksiciae]
MNNVIIFSHYDLIRFFLKNVVDKVTAMRPQKEKSDITLCHSLPEVESAIQFMDQPIVIFDTDDVSRFDLFRLLKLINKKAKKNRIFIFTKEPEESRCFAAIRYISSFVFSKTATQAQLESVLYPIMYHCDENLRVRAHTETTDRLKFAALTPRENQICQYLLSGLTNADIARLLDISPKTTSAHRVNIYNKYQVNDLIGLYSRLKR